MNTQQTRRQLLRSALALTAGIAASAQARAQTAPDDYKALVCVYLAGGNDSHNLIVPLDPAANAEYRRLRAGLALPDGSASLIPVSTGGGVTYGLNSGLQSISGLWASRRLAVVANMGPLAAPTTRAQVLAGTANLPSNLYSHSDQTQAVHAGNSHGGGGTGWGGRAADALIGRNGTSRFPASVSIAGRALYTTGAQVAAASLLPGFELGMDGMNVWPSSAAQARANALSEILMVDGGVRLIQAANTVRRDAITLNGLLRSGVGTPISVAFPGTDIGQQLRQVARVMSLRASTGMKRQVFYCQLGGFDTHSNQGWTHWDLMRQLSDALAAFNAATVQMNLGSAVTTFTQSEFGRTLQPSGSGSDHGWGGHQLVMGGAVRGGEVWGKFPYPALGGPDDAGGRGALIPTTSLEQFGATLARWFGADGAALSAAFPNLGAFAPQDLGFMLPT